MNPTFDAMMKAMDFHRCNCKDCQSSGLSVAYPKLLCNIKGEYVAPDFVCKEFKAEEK